MNIKDLENISIKKLADEYFQMGKQVFDETKGRIRVVCVVVEGVKDPKIVSGMSAMAEIETLISTIGKKSLGIIPMEQTIALAKVALALSRDNHKEELELGPEAIQKLDSLIDSLIKGLSK